MPATAQQANCFSTEANECIRGPPDGLSPDETKKPVDEPGGTRADETSETRGVMKAIVDGETDEILGCAFLGIECGELMSMVEIAMLGHVPYTVLRDGIFAHPTLAESMNNLFSSLEG